MRRTLFWFRGLFGGALVALLLGALPLAGLAQPPAGVSGTALYVPTGGTIRLQMSSKKPIKRVVNPRDAVLGIRTVLGDPTTILLTGQQSDVTRLELEDEAGLKEVYDVVVQRDIENLKTQLKRAAPTSAITATPISDNSVVLSGTVANPEDVDMLTKVAEALGFKVISNALRVGGVQQVQLDVVIAEVNRDDLRQLNFNFLLNSRNFYFGQTTGGAISSIGSAGGVANGAGSLGPSAFGPLAGSVGTANVLTGVVHSSWGFLAFIQALRTESVAKVVAEPHQVTLSGRPSNFHSGGQQAVPSGGGINGVGATFIPFGTDINATPIVLGNGKIYLEIDARLENPGGGSVTIGGAIVDNRVSNSVTTTVELESGQTFVLGGIMTHTVTASNTKVPVLGDLPFFGTFFSAKSYDENEQEIIILVTPRLVDAQDCGQAPKILPGQETRRPDDFELFLEGILEAPRGQRDVFEGNHYVPAYKNGPSAGQFPCGLNGGCGSRGCNGGCGTANCGGGCTSGCGTVATSVAPVETPVRQTMHTDDGALPLPAGPGVEVKVTPLPAPVPESQPLNLPVTPGGQ